MVTKMQQREQSNIVNDHHVSQESRVVQQTRQMTFKLITSDHEITRIEKPRVMQIQHRSRSSSMASVFRRPNSRGHQPASVFGTFGRY